ncbi:polyprenyl synthetase family protein [Mesonia sp. K7]|uniref:polyprenyl synthetase family protein n=1 Tax=Mesonia sp. K7 TaxID=2218606 RepID=UPI000DA9F175|nr:polyprenyl synthetase family protein [Mesonia sp. K7]PZD78428.1 polyprenyl synthetase family protein [Mesonia sp. K7]
MDKINFYRTVFSQYLIDKIEHKQPRSLYEPVEYILNLGGKKIRPVLVLLAAETYDCNYEKALDAALAIEIFHNFSLMHDDIMDEAPLRRGKKTVHHKWDINTGILSGDAMLIQAYQYFENYDPKTFQALAKLFSKTALEVCEGQQYDIDFENQDEVEIEDYLKMIEYKTAVLIGAALQMGGIVAGVSDNEQQKLYEFGKNLGVAFQLQDDYLDAFGNPKMFGKQVGGDIIENKKTYLYIKALELAPKELGTQLKHLYSIEPSNPKDKINTIKLIFEESGAVEAIKGKIVDFTEKALSQIENLETSQENKQIYIDFSNNLMKREV